MTTKYDTAFVEEMPKEPCHARVVPCRDLRPPKVYSFSQQRGNIPPSSAHLLPGALGLALLEHLLDDLLLLDQESTNDAVLDTVGAARATIGTGDSLLGLGDGGVLPGAEGRDTGKVGTTVLHHPISFCDFLRIC
jgi:hypothetical protein